MSAKSCGAGKRKRGKFYGVCSGRTVGVYDSWGEARLQVDGYQGAEFKRFDTEQEAKAYAMGVPFVVDPSEATSKASLAKKRPSKQRRVAGTHLNIAPAALDVYTHAIVQEHRKANPDSILISSCQPPRPGPDFVAAWGVHFAFDAGRLRKLAIDPGRLDDKGGPVCTESAHVDVQSSCLANANDRDIALRAAIQMRSDLCAIVEATRTLGPLLEQCKSRHIIDGDNSSNRSSSRNGGREDAETAPLRVCIVTASTWALRTVRDYLPRWADNGYRVKGGGLPPNMDLLVEIDSFMRRFGPAWVGMAYSRPRHSTQDDHARREAPVPWQCPTAAWTEFDPSPAGVATTLSRPLAIARGHALFALSQLPVESKEVVTAAATADDVGHGTDNCDRAD